jgi:hypothetical protein
VYVRDDRVLETSTTTGTGALTLAGAVTGYKTFATAERDDGSAIQVGDVVPYYIEAVDANGVPTGAYESGIGTYSAAATLTRTTVLKSSNADAVVTLAAGTKYVGIGLLASRVLQLDDRGGYVLPAVSATAMPTPATDTLKVFARKVAGRMTLKYIGPSGVDQFIQDKISTNRNAFYLPNGGSTVGLNLGINWTTGGTVSHPTPSTTAPAIYSQQKRTRWANIVTTTNQTLGIHTVTAEKSFWRGNAAGLGGFNFHARFAIGLWPAATVRLFVGLSDQNTSPVASDTLAGNCCGLWHDTTEAASVLNFVTRNGTTATKAAITLAANLAAGQCFDFYMWAAPNGSAIFYRLDEINTGTTLVDTSTTTTIPTATAFMGPTLQMSNGTANTTVTTTAMELMAHSCQSDN